MTLRTELFLAVVALLVFVGVNYFSYHEGYEEAKAACARAGENANLQLEVNLNHNLQTQIKNQDGVIRNLQQAEYGSEQKTIAVQKQLSATAIDAHCALGSKAISIINQERSNPYANH